MALKIIRQPNQIALIGAPTSAGAHAPGQEKAPAALRQAGLLDRLREIGYTVQDYGDIPAQMYAADDESPRARNIPAVLAALNALRPHVEAATKAGALPLILGGDCTISIAAIAGVRRYYRHASLLYFDCDADLNTPATTPSGCLDGMNVAALAGHGASELVRFTNEPPLVREPDIVLFGLDRLDPEEQTLLRRSTTKQYPAAEIARKGAAASAEAALSRIHADSREFVLHFDVDVISGAEFSACDLPAPGGVSLADVRAALEVFARQKMLLAFEVTEFNPEKDPDGSAARLLVDLIVNALAARYAALVPAGEISSAPSAVAGTPAVEAAAPVTEPVAGPQEERLEAEPAPSADSPSGGDSMEGSAPDGSAAEGGGSPDS